MAHDRNLQLHVPLSKIGQAGPGGTKQLPLLYKAIQAAPPRRKQSGLGLSNAGCEPWRAYSGKGVCLQDVIRPVGKPSAKPKAKRSKRENQNSNIALARPSHAIKRGQRGRLYRLFREAQHQPHETVAAHILSTVHQATTTQLPHPVQSRVHW